MHVPFVEQQQQLRFGKLDIDQRHRDTVECQVPGGIPGILPGVWHDYYIVVAKMPPSTIAAALWRWLGTGRVTPPPFIHIIIKELFSPEQARPCLSPNSAFLIPLGCTYCTVE